MIGLTMPGIDEYATPTTITTRMWGVEVMGNAIETILDQRYLVRASSRVTIGLIFLMGSFRSSARDTVPSVLCQIGTMILLGL